MICTLEFGTAFLAVAAASSTSCGIISTGSAACLLSFGLRGITFGVAFNLVLIIFVSVLVTKLVLV